MARSHRLWCEPGEACIFHGPRTLTITFRAPHSPEVGMEFTAREARLKVEFADLYPPLVPNIWETAAEMGAKVLLWQVQQQGTDALNSRILDGQHFEFRGGWYRGTETDLRTRATDPAFNGPA